ncbi:hypothetical protein D3C80_1203210 [compost metagenome]
MLSIRIPILEDFPCSLRNSSSLGSVITATACSFASKVLGAIRLANTFVTFIYWDAFIFEISCREYALWSSSITITGDLLIWFFENINPKNKAAIRGAIKIVRRNLLPATYFHSSISDFIEVHLRSHTRKKIGV